ncbi:aminopeptidase P family protein [Marinivivus vitaminiproducens]|uniref:aminopeptidase P family protein n=1 Tax=Marinivivus vitaminiproducens TaxID=3035935 RepID=UPI002798D284|nr:aminopeptidase P family protein [Geminicoccaceae bacterium SCSIO 64248]
MTSETPDPSESLVPAESTDLAAALEASGSPYDPDGVDDLVRGLLAAGPAPSARSWHGLVAAEPSAELRGLLDARMEALRATLPADVGSAGPEGLKALRAALSEQDCHGLLLPRTDAQRSEYLPGSANRVAWLSRFTGSAGYVVVLPAKAALFIDGRYAEQAASEVDTGFFELVRIETTDPAAWLKANAASGQRIGYDPELHSPSEIERVGKALSGVGADLVALPANPVDALWTSRPPRPVSPLARLDVRYAGEAEGEKRARMGEAVAAAGADVAVITAADSLAWLLNLRAHDIPYNPLFLGFGLLHKDGRVDVFTDPRRKPIAMELGNGVVIQPEDALPAALAEAGSAGSGVLVDPATTNTAIVEAVKGAGARVVEGADPCVAAKARKNATELAGAKAAHLRDAAAMVRFLAWIDLDAEPGQTTEWELAERLDAERAKDPLFRGPSFPTISASGPNGALPHYRVTEASARPLDEDALYVVDSGGQYLDATTDITRTIVIGRPTALMRRAFTAVLRGHIAIDQAIFPRGTRGGQLDILARQHLWRMGLDFDHGTGHGIGSYLCVHEGPQRISKRSGDAVLEAGMIISNEPGYYKPGLFGIRIENLLTVVELPAPTDAERTLMGFRNLTRVPIDRRLIDPVALSDDELAWVDSYHALVRKEVMPLVEADEDTATWLAGATSPLRSNMM